jgi:hypothetical protein
MVTPHKIAPNPLMAQMRQPKIYIRLPSNGEFWENGALEQTENGEYPVFSMTAQDELKLKIPDALMNGQAVVDVIQHCVPNIKNAWAVPNIDMDVLLIAIRIATYGEKMSVPIKLGSDVDYEYELDLRVVVDQLMHNIAWDPIVPINENLIVHVRPITYKTMTQGALQTFETQKIIQIVNDESVAEEDKIRIFKESFAKLNKLTLGVITESIFNIESSGGGTSDRKHIQEFMDNVDKEIFDKVKGHIDILREHNSIKPLKIKVTDEMRAIGITDEEIEVPLNFDPSNFFG